MLYILIRNILIKSLKVKINIIKIFIYFTAYDNIYYLNYFNYSISNYPLKKPYIINKKN